MRYFFRRSQLPRLRSVIGQTLLAAPQVVDKIKRDMLTGQYDFKAPRGRIAGWRDSRNTYYIGEGHHRLAAALEIGRETGDSSHVLRLIENGRWENARPPKSRRLPTRSLWTRLLHKLGF